MKRAIVLNTLMFVTLFLSTPALRADDTPKPDAQPPASLSPDARQLIDQANDAYTKLNALNLSGTIKVDLQVANSAPETHSASFTSSFVAPNRFRHQSKDDVLIGNTGRTLYTFRADQNAYVQATGPKDRVASKDLPKDVATLLEMQDPSLLLAISKSPADELSEGVVTAAKADDTKIDDVSCPTLSLTQKDQSTVRVALDPQTHLIRRMTLDLTRPLKQRRADLSRVVLAVDYTTTKVNEPDKDELFAWSPPPGARDASAAAAARPLEDGPEASQLEGKKAPDFKLKSLDGKDVALSDLKGHVVVIDFWATWCPPCRASLPHLDKLYQAQKPKGLIVYAVDEQEDKAAVEKFVTQTKLSVPVLLDDEGKVGQQYGANAIPETVVVGKDGLVKKVIVGLAPEEVNHAVEAEMGK